MNSVTAVNDDWPKCLADFLKVITQKIYYYVARICYHKILYLLELLYYSGKSSKYVCQIGPAIHLQH